MAEKYRLKNKLYQKMNIFYYEILKNQKENNEPAVEKVKKKRNKVLDDYSKVKMNPSYESISHFLGFPMGSVSSGIMRMKREVQQFIREHHHEKV